MKRLGIEGTSRASFAFYNTKAEIDFFAETLQKIVVKLR
jgi:cysteine desulfurase/selenocysteine lyase